jgi:HEAT repeat protein
MAPQAVVALSELLRPDGSTVSDAAAMGLGELGPIALPALPSLIRVLRDARAGRQIAAAVTMATALAKIAPNNGASGEGVAVLMEGLTLHDQRARVVAAEAIGEFGPAALVAIPRMIELLKQATDNPNLWRLRQATARSLGLIAPTTDQADHVLAALIRSLDERPDELGVHEVIEALARFGPKAGGAVPRLRSLLQTNKVHPHATATAKEVVAKLERAR